VKSYCLGKKLKNPQNGYTRLGPFHLYQRQKKPISELLPSEIISKTISIDNALVKTDLKELHSIELLACNPACGQVAGPNSVANRTLTRPLKGGLSITSSIFIISLL
jgi:hypothetical protein